MDGHKYSGERGYSVSLFDKYNGPPMVLLLLVMTSNVSLATSTWKKYGNVSTLIKKMESIFNTSMPFPFTDRSTLLCCCYFIMKGSKSESIESNLASLRTEHLVRGFDSPSLRPVPIKAAPTRK